MAGWKVVFWAWAERSTADLSDGMTVEVVGGLWRHVAELVEPLGGAWQ
jgi:hypothetical protein